MSDKAYSEMTKQELDEMLLSLTREQFNLRIQKTTSEFTKPHLIKKVRRDIARVKMYMAKSTKTGEQL